MTVSPEELIEGQVEISSDSEIFDFKDAPDGYFLLDLSYKFKLSQIECNLIVQNVLNSSYRDYLNNMRYFADERGRNFLFTINYLLNTKSKPNENARQF
jgi:iron complex outermembrane receptor protein